MSALRPTGGFVTALMLLALTAMILTKENAFFVGVAVIALLIANYWLRFGIVTRELLLATVIGPLLGVVILGMLAGGASALNVLVRRITDLNRWNGCDFSV